MFKHGDSAGIAIDFDLAEPDPEVFIARGEFREEKAISRSSFPACEAAVATAEARGRDAGVKSGGG